MDANEVDLEELERQTVRLTERYLAEVVLAFDLCPWAAPALEAGRVQVSVLTDDFSTNEFARLAAVCDAKLRDTRTDIELVLLVMPRLRAGRLDMDQLLMTIRTEMAKREGVASFALAAFHPEAEPDTQSGERFIPFLRRSPDALVQAVKFSSLAAVDSKLSGGTTFLDPATFDMASWSSEKQETVRARIARRNLGRVLDRGIGDLEARYTDIMADRDRTHRALGLRARGE
jgi:hypothetical protein